MEIIYYFCHLIKKYTHEDKPTSIYNKRGAHGISWAGPTPLGDYLLGVYPRIFLESFAEMSLRNSWIFLKTIHHIIMLWFTSKFAKNILL
jgi:hypothetical protein